MKRDFTNGAAWSTAASWLEQGTAALIFLVIAKLIGVDSFGIVSMAFAFLFLGEYLVRDTVTEAIVERHELEDGRLEATFVALTGFSLVIMLALMALAPIVARFYGEAQVASLLIAVSPTVLLLGLAGVSSALLRRRLEYKVISIRIIVGVFTGGIVGITMALNDFGAWSLVGQRLAEIGINSILSIRAARWWPKRIPGKSDFALLKGLGPRVVHLRAITLVITQTPTVMLGIFADPRAVGLFAFAWRLAEIVLSVSIKPLQGVAQAAIAELKRQKHSTRDFFIDLTELAGLVGFVAPVGLALVAFPLTTVLLGPEWTDASSILPFICIAIAVIALTAVQEAYLLAMDDIRPYTNIVTAEALVGLVIVGAATPFGPEAAAGAVALRALLALPFRTRAALAPEGIDVKDFLQALVAPAVVAGTMAATVGLWRYLMIGNLPDVLYLAAAVFIGVLTVAVLLIGFMPKTVARLRSFVAEPEAG